jgi:hypothetical protein
MAARSAVPSTPPSGERFPVLEKKSCWYSLRYARGFFFENGGVSTGVSRPSKIIENGATWQKATFEKRAHFVGPFLECAEFFGLSELGLQAGGRRFETCTAHQ